LGLVEPILGIEFCGSEHGWVFGGGSIKHDQYHEDYGIVGRSTDVGISWSFLNLSSGPVDKNGPVVGLSFPDAKEGWAIGSSVIRHTTDGGARWDERYQREYDPSEGYGFESIWFLNPTTGWVSGYQDGDMGYFSGIIRTTDGGVSWKKSRAQHPLIKVRFLDAQVGIAAGMAIPVRYLGNPGGRSKRDGIVMLTTDGGDSWTEIYRTNDRRLLHVHVNGSGQYWVVGEGGDIVHGGLRRGSPN
jgi:photosystem II stability/assembly factor-like uncharacterized protein